MPRSRTIPSAVYPPGTYAISVDNFTSANTRALRLVCTRENWPGTVDDVVARVTLTWDTGGGVSADLLGGVVIGRDGQPVTTSVIEVDVPEVASGNSSQKRSVGGGTFVAEVLVELRTELTIEAV